MPLFTIDGKKKLELARLTNFNQEKDLQHLVETNLETVFSCRFVATEFSTGAEHAGRIDTLALSEENNPVIIEYKKTESSDLINQSLFYLSWINDHRGDFEIAVHKTLGTEVKVDWEDIRVICIAPGFKKYDLHAVKMMGASIELWQYRLFDSNSLYLDEVFRKSTTLSSGVLDSAEGLKNPVMVAAGKKAAITRATGTYTFEQHLEGVDETVKSLMSELRDFCMDIDESVEESPKKFYVAYKVAQNFVCVETSNHKITLFLKLNPKDFKPLPENSRDVTDIGHYGTGNFEYTIKASADMKKAKELIQLAFERVGG